MSAPRLSHRVLEAPRAGAAVGTSEDAAAVAAEAWPVGAAVADGATESAFAGLWARTLAQALARDRATDEASFRRVLNEGREEWRKEISERATDGPWYVRAKAEEGAFAAILSLRLSENGTWRALSVGDCCLFRLREGHGRRSWPFETPDAFTNRPPLVASRANHSAPPPRTASGTWAEGDTFLLATDAAAAWLLGREDVPVGSWDQDSFRAAVRTARERGTLRNDDVTVLVLDLHDGG
jgi:hypothetical protein